MVKVRTLALVEHVDRELDLVSLLKARLEDEHGVELRIANFYADAPLLLSGPAPDLVLMPFFYAAEDLVMRDYVAAWPDARFVNLAWEQLFYPSHEAIKAPRDAFTRERVLHLAWSRAFVDYLRGRGVAEDAVRLVGHGLYRLYGPPYRDYFPSRAALAAEHGLDAAKPWVFVPENYRWAFFGDTKLRKLARRDLTEADLFAMRDYCRRSLAALLRWSDALGRRGGVEVVFRPRPATNVAELTGFAREALGNGAAAFRLTKAGTAREWTLAADIVASSYSTVLIEAAIAGKAILKVDAEPIPEGLRYDWCDLVPGAADEAAFVAACSARDPRSGEALRDWAEALFFPAGDPVDGLVRLIAEASAGLRPGGRRSVPARLPLLLRLRVLASGPAARHALLTARDPAYFYNLETHEKDLFPQSEARRREQAWRRLLKGAGRAQ